MNAEKSWLVPLRLLVYLGIIPVNKSKCIHFTTVLIWLLISIGVGASNCYIYYYDFNWTPDFSLSKMFSYFSTDILINMQTICGIPLITCLAGKKICVDEISSMVPRRPKLFVTLAVFGVGSSVLLIYAYTLEDRKITALFMSLVFLLNYISLFASVSIIGVSANQFCNHVQVQIIGVTLHNRQGRLTKVISDYRSLQSLLQAHVFLIFITDLILLITDAFLFIENNNYYFLPFILYLVVRLCYIAYVLDDCYSQLKAALPNLRWLFRSFL